jgi:hypothetical protein
MEDVLEADQTVGLIRELTAPYPLHRRLKPVPTLNWLAGRNPNFGLGDPFLDIHQSRVRTNRIQVLD